MSLARQPDKQILKHSSLPETLNMTSHNILITGASGYLGGTLLARWNTVALPAYNKLFALVRTDAQAEAVKQYSAEPISFDTKDERAVMRGIVDNKITVVYFLINAMDGVAQVHFIKALAEVKKLTGLDVHFLHVSLMGDTSYILPTSLIYRNNIKTSGAKLFSSHAGAPTEKPLLDNDPNLYSIQKAQVAPLGVMQTVCIIHPGTHEVGSRQK